MDAKTEKLSSTAPFNFRPGPALAAKISDLQELVAKRGGHLGPTEIVRDGLLGCWPEVSTYLLVRHTTAAADATAVARLVAIAQKAIEHGVTPEALEAEIAQLMERKLVTATAS